MGNGEILDLEHNLNCVNLSCPGYAARFRVSFPVMVCSSFFPCEWSRI